jgi:L-lactate dehydrogenase (cytochrome)
MLRRAREAGFHTLVLTVDLPAASRRERQTRGGLVQPPRLTPRLALQVARCPAWAMGIQTPPACRECGFSTAMPTREDGPPALDRACGLPAARGAGLGLCGGLREGWDGALILKGVMEPESRRAPRPRGWMRSGCRTMPGGSSTARPPASTSCGRSGPATDLPLIFDSGIEGGLDILRALALGADFVMMGRAWHYALGALGAEGPAHLHDLLSRTWCRTWRRSARAGFDDLAARLMTRDLISPLHPGRKLPPEAPAPPRGPAPEAALPPPRCGTASSCGRAAAP